jgi:copper(I)-binding protein
MRHMSALILITPLLAAPGLARAVVPLAWSPANAAAVTASAGVATGTDRLTWNGTPAVSQRRGGNSGRLIAVADTSGIDLEHVWARPTIGAATSGAVYFTVTDKGGPDQLVGASTPIAATAEVHETIDDHGIMKMRPVPSLPLEPGKPVTLKPGGYHVMLTGLKQALKVGDSFPVTLTFAHAQPITVTAKVETMTGSTQNQGAMPGMH